MKTKKLPLLLIILALFLYSCEFIDTEWGGGGGSGGFPTTTQTRTFKAINPVTNTFYNVNAVLLYKGKKCDVWGEQAANVSQYTAQNVANDYDNNIYSKMMSAFNSGESFIEDGKAVANNPMEYASWMVDGDGKLTILLLNINAGSEEYIVAGYFHPINLLWDPNSNYCNMIYINSKLAYDSSELNNTVAHEMQHLMNFAISINKRSERNSNGQITGIKQMDTWIDEGLAGAAEWVWSGEHSMGRVRDYNEDRSGTIKQGNNFYVWESKPASILDDYATSYLFFQWLRLQAGSAGIYKTIINSSSFDYRAVTTAANGAMTGKGYNDWGTLLKTWLA
ncbi:MAG: hypothetical protein LBH42_10040, partial [Treponema sp.]|nr:hypothetical protein [Treponema sp.]